jgi:hypothetical protein
MLDCVDLLEILRRGMLARIKRERECVCVCVEDRQLLFLGVELTWRICRGKGFAPPSVEGEVGDGDRQSTEMLLDLVHDGHSSLDFLLGDEYSLIVARICFNPPFLWVL